MKEQGYVLFASSNWEMTMIFMLTGLIIIAGITLFILSRYLLRKEKRLNEIIGKKTQYLSQQVNRLKKEHAVCDMLSSVVRYTDSGVIIADADGNIEYVNQGFTRMTGYNLDSLREFRGGSIISASCSGNIINIINEALRMKKSIRYETYTYTRKGRKKWISSLITPVFDREGDLERIIIIDTDISELKQLKEEFVIQEGQGKKVA